MQARRTHPGRFQGMGSRRTSMSDRGRPAEYRIVALLDSNTGQVAYIAADRRGKPRWPTIWEHREVLSGRTRPLHAVAERRNRLKWCYLVRPSGCRRKPLAQRPTCSEACSRRRSKNGKRQVGGGRWRRSERTDRCGGGRASPRAAETLASRNGGFLADRDRNAARPGRTVGHKFLTVRRV